MFSRIMGCALDVATFTLTAGLLVAALLFAR
jgi:hypothetical protein